jgi:putative membrane protein insertion efficiency factor
MTLSRLLALPLIWLVRAYQLVISPMFPPSCRFYPSCSAYALTALERYGPLAGTWLAARRLLRCHPWNPGGVDHVPERSLSRPTMSERTHHHAQRQY